MQRFWTATLTSSSKPRCAEICSNNGIKDTADTAYSFYALVFRPTVKSGGPVVTEVNFLFLLPSCVPGETRTSNLPLREKPLADQMRCFYLLHGATSKV